MAGFQNAVNRFPAPAVEGDFASDNPRKTMWAGDSALVAGPNGVAVGRFAWADANGVVHNDKPVSGVARLGFVSREGQSGAFITTWMAGASLVINAGNPVTLHVDVDAFVRVTVANATYGQKAFASNTDGTVQPGAAGATIAGYTETPWIFVEPALIGALAPIVLED